MIERLLQVIKIAAISGDKMPCTEKYNPIILNKNENIKQ